jgi:hypothetical protein
LPRRSKAPPRNNTSGAKGRRQKSDPENEINRAASSFTSPAIKPESLGLGTFKPRLRRFRGFLQSLLSGPIFAFLTDGDKNPSLKGFYAPLQFYSTILRVVVLTPLILIYVKTVVPVLTWAGSLSVRVSNVEWLYRIIQSAKKQVCFTKKLPTKRFFLFVKALRSEFLEWLYLFVFCIFLRKH